MLKTGLSARVNSSSLINLQICQVWTLICVAFVYGISTVQMMGLSATFSLVAEDCCLKDSLIYEKDVDSVINCAQLCLMEHLRCKSINFEKEGRQYTSTRMKCQLNNSTKTSKPEKLNVDTSFHYLEPIEVKENNNLLSSTSTGGNRGKVFQIYSPKFNVCAEVVNRYVFANACDVNDAGQRWDWARAGLLRHTQTGECLDVDGVPEDWRNLRVSPCDPLDPNQQWSCNGNMVQVGNTSFNMNYGSSAARGHVVLFHGTGSHSQWKIYNTNQSICTT